MLLAVTRIIELDSIYAIPTSLDHSYMLCLRSTLKLNMHNRRTREFLRENPTTESDGCRYLWQKQYRNF